jgi:hypothetical protein
MTQEYGKLLKNSFKNPFDDLDDIEDFDEEDYFDDFDDEDDIWDDSEAFVDPIEE